MTNVEARQIIEALSHQTDPQTGEVLSEDTALSILQDPQTVQALSYALGTMDFAKVIADSSKSFRPSSKNFTLTEEEKNQIHALPGVPLNVSQIAGMINSVLPEGRRKMQPSKINKWLTKKGILEDDIYNGKTHHKLTDYGNQLGARGMKVPSRYGNGDEYWNNVYPVRIQAEIINHAEEIMNE